MSISQRRGAWALFCSGIVLAVVCGVSAPAMALTPTIGVVSPASGIYAITPNSSITIFGTNFQLGATITVGSLSGATVAGSTATATVPFVFVSTTQVRFYWPNTGLAPGVYNVQVTNSPTESATLTGGFTVQAPQPTISSVSPNTATYAISPSASVTIVGSNFVVGATITVGSLSGVTVAGSTATAATPFVFVNSVQVRFYWPNTQLAPGSYTAQVTNPLAAGGLSESLASAFTVVAPQPTITSTSPNPVTYGVSPTGSINIFGSGFVVGATITVGSLSGVTVAGSTATAATPFVFVSSAQLRFYWPNTSLVAASYTVEITNPAAAGGLATTLVGGFTVAAAQLTVISTSPSSGTYAVTPSTAVSIFGTSFLVGATVTISSPSTGTTLSGTTVLGSTATVATPFVHVSSGQLRFYWPNPSLNIGSYTVTVTNPAASGGATANLPGGFVVVGPQPTISTISPSPVTYEITPSLSISIFGTNFTTGATVMIGTLTGGVCQLGTCLSGVTASGSQATAAAPFVFVNATRLSFYWPNRSLTPGSYPVQVTNPQSAGGLFVSVSNAFTVSPPLPIIQSVTPSTVDFAVTPSQSVAIRGIRFYAPIGTDGPVITVGTFTCTAVSGTVASATVPCVYVSTTRLEFYWDNGAISPGTAIPPGSYAVQVQNPSYVGAGTGSLAAGFTIAAPQPRIEKVSPAVVTAGITTSRVVTIVGFSDSGFRPGAAVVVGNLSCVADGQVSTPTSTTPCVYVSPTQIKFYWDTDRSVDPTAPLLGPGIHNILVTNPIANGGLSGTLVGGFRVTVDPEILAVEPSTGIGAGALGAVVTITSTGFGSGASARIGTGGVQDSAITMTSGFRVNAAGDGGTITINVANTAAPGLRDVTLTTPSGLTSGCLTCRVMINLPPVVASVSPALGPGASGVALTLAGANFSSAQTTLTELVTNAATTLSVASTAGFPASGVVAVDAELISYASKTATNLLGLTRAAFETTAAGHANGAVVTLVTVTLPAGVTGRCVVAGSAGITCSNVAVAPSVLPGSYPVIVTNPDGGRGSGLMTINAGLSVSTLTPASGNPGPPITLTIAGAGFQPCVGIHCVEIVFDSELTVSGVTRIDAATLSAQLTVATTASSGYHPLTVTNPDGGRITVDQAFYVGTPPANLISAIASYGQQAVPTVQYRRWTGGAWSSNLTGPSLSAPPVWQVMKANPIRDERILAVVDEQRRLTLHAWNGQSWLGGLQAAASTGLARPTQTVDVAFESVSGRGVAVYGTTNSTTLRYRIWDGISWSAEALVEDFVNGQMTGGLPLWVRLESRPGTNDLVLVYGDQNDDIAAMIWRGDRQATGNPPWEDSVLLTTSAAGHDSPIFDVAFEGLTGRAMALWATATAGTQAIPRYRIWNSGWSGEAMTPSAASDLPQDDTQPLTALRLVGDPSSNRLALAASSGPTSSRLTAQVWTGSEWPTTTLGEPREPRAIKTLTTTLSMGGGGRGFDVGWEGVSGDAVAVYGATGSPLGFSRMWSASAPLSQDPWSAESVLPVPPLVTPAAPAWIELAGARGGDGLGLGVLFDTVGIVALARWDGALWGGATVAQNLASGLVSSVTGRAIAVSLAQHLAGSGPVITPPQPATDTTAPDTPALVAGTPTATSVNLSWTAVGDDGLAGGTVSRYELRRTLGTVTSVQAITPTQAPGGTETVTVATLRGGSTYVFELRALDETPNASGWSVPVTVITLVDQPPPAIADLRVVAAATTASTVSVQWTIPIDDSGPLAGYLVRYSVSTPFNFDTATPYTLHAPQSSGTTASLVIDGLVPGTTYRVAVKAMDAIGQLAAISNVLDVSTAPPSVDTSAPAPITDLAVVSGATTSGSLLLTWTATGDDGSVGTASAYEARYAMFPLTTVNFGQGTVVAAAAPGPSGHAQELLVAGLTSNTNFYVAIQAIDDGGRRSGLSNVAVGRTALRLGYTLVSVPRVPVAGSDTADAVFGDDVGIPVYAYRWNPSGPLPTDGCYEGTVSTPAFPLCGVLAPIQAGSAYFLRSTGTQAVLDAPGPVVSSPTVDVRLELGFNMVGNPYEQDILLSQVQVKRGTGAPVSYAIANAPPNGWVARAIYLYDGVTTQPSDGLSIPPAAFKSWNGVWVQSFVSDAFLVFTRP